MELACLDLEGVLVPEIWIAFAELTGIDELRATTRDIPDYNVLMKQRLSLLDQHGLRLPDIQAAIAKLEPLPGAVDFSGLASREVPDHYLVRYVLRVFRASDAPTQMAYTILSSPDCR